MPEEGFESITISKEVYDKLKAYAEETHRSMSKAVEHLVKTCPEDAKP